MNFEIIKCNGTNPIFCNNDYKCNILECFDPPNNCDIDTPFKCRVNGIETCVKSQIDCDCPIGYIKLVICIIV